MPRGGRRGRPQGRKGRPPQGRPLRMATRPAELTGPRGTGPYCTKPCRRAGAASETGSEDVPGRHACRWARQATPCCGDRWLHADQGLGALQAREPRRLQFP
jgi:hypothetical protein